MSTNSIKLFAKAKQVMPGGVNSPVRAFGSVDSEPLFISHADGPYIFDADNNRYIDYVCSWGPLILGHNHPLVTSAIKNAVDKGVSFGAPTEIEVKLANLVSSLFPSIEQIRMTSSGTEATGSAIRLARGFTGRDKILKFSDCYHGHSDCLLVKAGSGALTLGIPGCAGVPKDIAKNTLTAEFNNLAQVEEIFTKCGDEIAAIIVEPVAANMNLILPDEDFLPGLRKICDTYGAVLIFDEVITGFRVAPGGAQEYYDVKPDLTCLGKVIGGGLPVGAFGGRTDIMQHLAPTGPVYHAGTLSGNPLAMHAGFASINELKKPGTHEYLLKLTNKLVTGMRELAVKHGINFEAHALPGLFGFRFLNDTDNAFFKQFFRALIQEGVYLAPSAYECGFMSTAHTDEIIVTTLAKMDKVLKNATGLAHKKSAEI